MLTISLTKEMEMNSKALYMYICIIESKCGVNIRMKSFCAFLNRSIVNFFWKIYKLRYIWLGNWQFEQQDFLLSDRFYYKLKYPSVNVYMRHLYGTHYHSLFGFPQLLQRSIVIWNPFVLCSLACLFRLSMSQIQQMKQCPILNPVCMN